MSTWSSGIAYDETLKVQIQQDLDAAGVFTHVGESFTVGDTTYSHNANTIASGFLTDQQAPITVYEKLLALHKKHPDFKIIAHPESEEHILDTATYIGSTAGMINYVKENPKEKFIVATEAGILHKMQQEVPSTVLIPAPAYNDNTCACSECGYMKVNTLQKLYDCLVNESPRIEVSDTIRERALLPIERMLELSK